MSTNERIPLTQDDAAAAFASSFEPELPVGLPDAATLARLANEFFRALPNEGAERTGDAADAGAGAPAIPSAISLPSDPQLPTLPASADAPGIAPLTAPYQAPSPAVPGVLGGAPSFLDAPGFSFLQEARPIFAAPQASGQAPYPDAAPLPGTAPAGSAFSFLAEARPLFADGSSFAAAPQDAAGEWLPQAVFGLELRDEFLPAPDLALLAEQAQAGVFDGQRPLDSTNAEPVSTGHTYEPAGSFALTPHFFDVEAVRRDFPILQEKVNGRPLVWLDNAATTQKPQSVIDRLSCFYQHENSNVHRAAHELAARATDAYEAAREKVRRFVNAPSINEIVFVRGTTEAINLVAQAWGRRNLGKDDEVVITWLEHHANIVPWQMVCAETGARLRVAPVDDSGQILLDEYEKLLNARTRLVSITHVSNALGTITPAEKMIEMAHRYGAKVLLDGAQSVSHMRVDVQELDPDFFVFSGHKVFAPTGIGVLYGKPEVLAAMPPWQGGGNMIQDVTFEKTIYHGPPQRFEAGTGNIADAVGLGAAIDYLDRVGMYNIARHEHELLQHATEELLRIPKLRIVGTAKEKAGVLSFVIDGHKTEEIGSYLNSCGIAVRSGHHCAQPILRRFGHESTVRASLALYNTHEEVEKLAAALRQLH
ncbi:family 2A encapsulin nanocompartment cargo protein cysteine desulfurase [Silvibacterium dinghuense]|uniref:cysteine desulfurase n=1 Tax=Silvibacterium dinghuense TaxID=1560006 RepID=A0A4Q1SJI6_9BACT|nr:family 2A encapsulin nanocompartment cargo protein cysteine desulfurase [Silvibacterium dinghuense]RXS97595.1 SufS family cysteine desulfurase [Silvibacterium dinghuense]GGH00327.1 cysteine desulfurase [Silvibacterium dinghuense]